MEIGELRSYLRGKLPGYMMPAAFVVLEALPRTPSGKLDRRSLPAPSRERIQTSEGFVAPRTAVEEAVAQVWAEVLGLERVSAHDNFFELGGHSLLATQVVARLRKMFGIELRLRDLFERPTIVGLAEVTELARRSDAEVGCEIIKPSPRQPFRATRSPEGAITLPDDVSRRE